MTARREKARPDWVKVVVRDVEPAELREHLHCERCGQRQVLALPQEIEALCRVAKGFEQAHSECR